MAFQYRTYRALAGQCPVDDLPNELLATHQMSNSDRSQWPEGHERRIKAAGFAWDLVLQLAALRRRLHLSQSELAERLGTQQPNVARLERPTYDRQNLQTLRAVGDALDAYVDVIYVPRDQLETYLQRRYLPALEDPADSEQHVTSGDDLPHQPADGRTVQLDAECSAVKGSLWPRSRSTG